MDFENMKRKQLQALCKEHGIPANLTNLEMVNKLTSLLKVNDEKPLTRGRSCLKILDENVNDRESDVVNRKVKKVKFSPDNEIIEFTRSVGVKRGGRRKIMLYKNKLNSDELKAGILDSPVRVTRSQRVNMEDGVNEKKGAKDSVISVNESKDEGGVTTRRSLKNKEVLNEGVNDGLRMGRRVRSRKNAKESVEDSKEEIKIDNSDKKELDRVEKKDKKVTFISGGQKNEYTKAETEAKETKRVTRRKSMALVQNEVDADVREEVVEKPARVTRTRNLKPVEDNVSNKRNRTRSKEVIETSEKEVRVKTRRSQQSSVVEAPQEALKRSGRVANKAKGGTLTNDVSKEMIVTKGRTRNQSNLTVETSTSESGTYIVQPKEKLEEPVEVPPRRSGGRRKSVFPLENLRGDDVASKKEKRNFLNSNDDEQANKGTKEESQEALKRSKRFATQVEDSVLAKDDIPENEVVPVGSSRRRSVVPSLENARSDEVAVVKEKRKSKANEDEIRSDEVAVVKDKRKSKANEDEIRSKGIKEPRKASKRSKRLAKQVVDPVLDKGDIAENKLEERRCSRRNAGKANVDTKILDGSVQEETSVVKEERRRSGRSAARHILAAVSDDKKEKGESKHSKRNSIVIQEKDYINKFALQDLDSLKESMSNSKVSVKTTVVVNTSTAGKKQQSRIKRSNVEVEVPMLEDMETVTEPDNKDGNISGSGVTMSFSRSSLNEVEPVPDDVKIVPAGIKDDTVAESSTLVDKLKEEGLLVDAYSSPSENNSASKSVSFSEPFNSGARPEENPVEELLKSDHEKPASKGLCPSSVLADDALPKDLTSDKQEPGAIAADSAEENGTGVSNEVLDNMEEDLDSGTKDEVAGELSTLADKLIEDGSLVDADASPSENNSTAKCLPHSDPFNSNARPEENVVELLLRSDHEEPASKGLCPSSVLADDAPAYDLTSDKQEPCAIAAHNAEEFATGLSNDVLDHCSLSQSDNMEENLDSGTKDEAAGELSTLADKLIEEGPPVDANASPSENNSSSDPFSDSFNSNTRLEENQVEELLQFDHKAPASKDLCPSSVLAEDAVPNEITSDKQEHGSIAGDNVEVLSDEVLDNCSLSQSDNMEENLDSGFNEQLETGVVTEGVTYGEKEPAGKGQCPSSALADDAVLNDITSDKQEHGAVAADYAEEFDRGLSNDVLDNMEENLDSGLKEQSGTEYIVTEGVTYGEQEPESKGLCTCSVLADNDITPDKLEQGATVADNAEEFDTGSSNEVPDNCSVNQSDDMEDKLDSGFKEQLETRPIVSVGVSYGEQELKIIDYAKEFAAGLSSSVSLDNIGAFDQINEMEVENSESGPTEQAEADSGPMEQVEAESDTVEAKCNLDAPTFTSQGEIHAEECANLEAAAFEKSVSSPIKAVEDLQEPGTLGDGITLHESPSEDSDEENHAGEEFKILFATPCYVSHSKDEKKASLDGDSRDEGLNREGQVSPVSDNDTSNLQSSIRGCGEHSQGEYLKSLFATPFGSRSSKIQISTSIRTNETSSQYKHSCHENENTASSAGDGSTQSVTPLKDTSEDEAGEELKHLFATPSVVPQSVEGHCYLFQSQLRGEAILTREGLDSSGKENLSESFEGLIKDKQVEHVKTPVSVKCTNQEITSTKGKYSQSHEMETYVCSGAGRNFSESEAGSVRVNQAPETSHITAFNNGDENEQEDRSRMLLTSPIITQSLDEMDGTSRKTEGKKNLLSGNFQGHAHNKAFPVAQLSSMDLDKPERIDSKHSETGDCLKDSSALEEENNEGQGNMLSATSDKSMTPVWNDEFSSQKPTVKETAECMKGSSAFEEENNEEGQGNLLYATSDKSMTPLWNDKFSSQTPTVKKIAECMKESSALEVENNEGQGNMLSTTSAINMTPLRNDEFSSQEPKRADVATPGEMFRDTEMNTRHECCVQEIVDIDVHKIEETVQDRDLLLRGTSRGLEEDIYAGIAKESTSPVISEPTCDDIEFSEQQMVPEINKSSLKNVKTSDAFNEGTEDHLKLLFATPMKGKSHSRSGEASSCQLKTAMIAMASEMAGKRPKQGSLFSGEPLTVEFISGGSDSTKRSCFSKEIEQFERGPLFPTPSKCTSPLQLEENLGCEEDMFEDLDGVKFLNSQEQNFAQQEDRQLLNETTDDIGEATLHWFQSNDGSVPGQTELEMLKENDSAHSFNPLHEKGEVTEDDDLAEGKEDDHLVVYQQSLEDRLINTDVAEKGCAVSDAVRQQPNILLTDIETENITEESTRSTDGISVSAESGILEFVAESTALRRQETVIITVEETKRDEVQQLEVKSISNAILQNIPNDDEYANEISTVLPADEQFHFPEYYVVENVSSTEDFTASTNECQHVSKEDDLAAERDRLVIFESTESSTSMGVNDSGLTTQMVDLPGTFAGECANKAHSALSEEPRSEIDQGMPSAIRPQDEEDSFDKKEHDSTEAVLPTSPKPSENISFLEEGFSGEEDTLMSQKINDLGEKKVPLTPAGVAKTSFAKHLNSTVKKKNARSILIHGIPNKLSQIGDMKENALSVKGDIGTLTTLRPDKRRALKDLPWK